jgi:anhydro-N-acetylmuramic acid kinase
MGEPVVIGVMSGSSLDGVDLAACRFFEAPDGHYHYQIEAAETIAYSQHWIRELQQARSASLLAGLSLDQDYGLYLGDLVQDFQKRKKLTASLVSSHGHTIHHNAKAHLSVQFGAGSAIHAKTQVPVVSDFRQGDLHLGGQGAPLAPVGDELLFHPYGYCLNLGGIANISFTGPSGKRVAFDVAPCNQVLNYLARQAGLSYDQDGGLAREGVPEQDLLDALNSVPFYQQNGPRSLDRSDIEHTWLPLIDEHESTIAQKLATFHSHLAEQIAEAIAIAPADRQSRLLVTGGGAFNRDLVQRIQQHFPGEVVVPDAQLVEFKEAVIFAFMGWLRWHNRINCLASVTGASRDHVAGCLYG